MAKKIEVKEDPNKKVRDYKEMMDSIGDEVVFKHKLILQLVDQVLKKHNKQHDDLLAARLYNSFDKELN